MNQFVLPKASLFILTHPDGEETPCATHEEIVSAICAETAYEVRQVPATGLIYRLELFQRGNIHDLGTFGDREESIAAMYRHARIDWNHPDFKQCEWRVWVVEVFADGENTEVPDSEINSIIARTANFED